MAEDERRVVKKFSETIIKEREMIGFYANGEKGKNRCKRKRRRIAGVL